MWNNPSNNVLVSIAHWRPLVNVVEHSAVPATACTDATDMPIGLLAADRIKCQIEFPT